MGKSGILRIECRFINQLHLNTFLNDRYQILCYVYLFYRLVLTMCLKPAINKCLNRGNRIECTID